MRPRVRIFDYLPAVVVVASFLAPLPAEATPPRAKARGPGQVLKVLGDIARGLKVTRYQHITRVRAKRGEYFFDCSGMAQWVLRRSAPAALRTVGKRPDGSRPLAVHFFKRIARVPPGKSRGPWYRVPDVTQARPGDVIAWKRPPWFRSKSTGHVAFVVSQPVKNTGPVRGHLFRLSLIHISEPTRPVGISRMPSSA